jgi:hypothetical protein
VKEDRTDRDRRQVIPRRDGRDAPHSSGFGPRLGHESTIDLGSWRNAMANNAAIVRRWFASSYPTLKLSEEWLTSCLAYLEVPAPAQTPDSLSF